MKPMDTSEILKTSEALSKQIRELMEFRNMAQAEIEDLEREHNNLIHDIEKSNNYRERAKLATKLGNCRRERRKLKDWLFENKSYFDYFGSSDGGKIQCMINNLVGIGRRMCKK